MLFGSELVDLLSVFAPSCLGPPRSKVHRIAAVKLSATGWLAAGTNDQSAVRVNHYVIALPVEGRAMPTASASLPASCTATGSAAKLALHAGLSLMATDATGNCGIDCMAYHSGQPRQLSRDRPPVNEQGFSGSAVGRLRLAACGKLESCDSFRIGEPCF
jgi:hypothetical protein